MRAETQGGFVLDFRMQTFLAACRTLNYTRAAEELSITQPAVSQHIAYLERHYGVKLFVYEGKRLALTPAGAFLREVAARMEHDEQLTRAALENLGSGEQHLSFGVTLTVGEYLIARPLARYLQAHPEHKVRVEQAGTDVLLRHLREGEIDCALIEGYFDKHDLAWREFCTQELVGVCAPGSCAWGSHASSPAPADSATGAAGRSAQGREGGGRPAGSDDGGEAAGVSFEELLGAHLFVREPGSGTRAVLEHALAEQNLTLASFARVTEVSSLNIIKEFVAAGVGISFLYEAAVAEELAAGALARIPLARSPLSHGITFVHARGSVFAETFERFYAELLAFSRVDAEGPASIRS